MIFLSFARVQLNEAQDEILKKKELLEDLQPDNTQNCMNHDLNRNIEFNIIFDTQTYIF